MDNTVLGLGVAIAIVVVLLYSCWTKEPSAPLRRKPRPQRQVQPGPRPVQRPAPAAAEPSQYGAGVDSRNAANRYQDLDDLKGYEDYGAVAQYMSVEPEVYESHAKYSQDMGKSTSGASMLPVRDDPNDAVPWVGLRKPRYQEAYAKQGARQEHSEIPDQMRSASFYCVG